MPKLYPGNKSVLKYFLFLLIIFFTQDLHAQVSSFTPASGPVGTTVTISGKGFLTNPATDTVYFGAVKAIVTAATATTLTVIVPAGASYQPISVTVYSRTSFSATPFIVTFPGAGPAFTANYFSAPHVTALAAATNSMLIGDLDWDGLPDLIGLDSSGSSFSVYKNTSSNGIFSLAAKSTFALGAGNGPGAIADLEGDGQLDFVSAATSGSAVSVYMNNTYGSPISFSLEEEYTTGPNPGSIAIADLDGDGTMDLIVANGDTTLTVYNGSPANSGTGHPFINRQIFTVTNGNKSLSTGDLDGDGKPDIIIANSNLNTISLLKNTSVKGTISLASKVDYLVGAGPRQIAVGDLDGDGKPDLGIVTANDNNLVLFKNTSTTGTISFADSVLISCGVASPTGVAIGDLDGDGKPDIAVSTLNQPTQTNSILAFKNTSSAGALSFAAQVSYPAEHNLYSIAINDINGDGKPDLIALGQSSNVFDVLINQVGASQPLHIQSFSPTHAAKGDTVRIHGTSFTGITSVHFGDTLAASFTILSDTVINAVVGSGASGRVTVTGPDGADSLAGFTFTDTTKAPPPVDTIPPITTPTPGVFKLLDLTGTLSGNQQVLAWHTLYDRSISYYVVEHSFDSTHFSALASVQSTDVDSGVYSYGGWSPGTGPNYYRLKMEDTTGAYSYSNWIVFQQAGVIPATLGGYPNPAAGSITVAPPNMLVQSQFLLADMNGKVIKKIVVPPNVAQITINLTGLVPGVYKLIWSDGTNYSYQSILILK